MSTVIFSGNMFFMIEVKAQMQLFRYKVIPELLVLLLQPQTAVEICLIHYSHWQVRFRVASWQYFISQIKAFTKQKPSKSDLNMQSWKVFRFFPVFTWMRTCDKNRSAIPRESRSNFTRGKSFYRKHYNLCNVSKEVFI